MSLDESVALKKKINAHLDGNAKARLIQLLESNQAVASLPSLFD